VQTTFFISALHEGEWSNKCPGRFAPEENTPGLPIQLEAGWIPEKVWMLWRRENLLCLPGIEPQFLSCSGRSLVDIMTAPTSRLFFSRKIPQNRGSWYIRRRQFYPRNVYPTGTPSQNRRIWTLVYLFLI
jgi:hypothetical protein